MSALAPERMRALVMAGATTRVEPASAPPTFAVGDRVRTRNLHPHGHTRLPRYIRGKTGVVVRQHGMYALSDSRAEGHDDPQWCYAVRFPMTALWGEGAAAGDTLTIDLWDAYLEPESGPEPAPDETER